MGHKGKRKVETVKSKKGKGKACETSAAAVVKDTPPDLFNHDFFTEGTRGIWPARNVLPPVKHQKDCNSCVAQTTAPVTGIKYGLENGKAPGNPAVQELVDRSTTFGAVEDGNSCRLTTLKQAYRYMRHTGVLDESDYGEYKGFREKHVARQAVKGKRYYIDKVEEIPSDATTEVVLASLNICPLTAVMVFNDAFQYFEGKEIYSPPKGTPTQLDEEKGWGQMKLHAVIIVDYGIDEQGNEFYIIMNSWGAGWGYFGFAKVDPKSVHFLSYPQGIHYC